MGVSTLEWVISSTGSPAIGGLYDQAIDRDTHDYVRTGAGAWAEVADSRTAVELQLSIRYGEWFADPEAGTLIPAMLEREEPLTAADLEVELRRCLGVLVADGVIGGLTIQVDEDAGVPTGQRLVASLSYTDLATGAVVDAVYRPS